MIPAAPLVGAVTTRPPAAFSSLTASANRLTQSMIESGSVWPRGSLLSLRWSAAARVVDALDERGAACVCREPHAIGMQRQLLAAMKHQRDRRVELDLVLAEQLDAVARLDRRHPPRDRIDVDRRRLVAFEAEHD